MKPRVRDQLKDFGFAGTVEEFRTALIAVKREHYPEWPDEELAYTKNQAADYCSLVRQRVYCQRLPRVFILRNLVNCRKNGLLGKMTTFAGASTEAEALSPDGPPAD